jgi:hypothetical protein
MNTLDRKSPKSVKFLAPKIGLRRPLPGLNAGDEIRGRDPQAGGGLLGLLLAQNGVRIDLRRPARGEVGTEGCHSQKGQRHRRDER